MSKTFGSNVNEAIVGYDEKGIYGVMYRYSKETSNLLLSEDSFINSFDEKAARLEALLIQLGYCAYYLELYDDSFGDVVQNSFAKKLSNFVDDEIVEEISLWHGNTYRFIIDRIYFARLNYAEIIGSDNTYLPSGIAWIFENTLETLNFEYDDESGTMDVGTCSDDMEFILECLTRMTHSMEPMNLVLDAVVQDIGEIKKLEIMLRLT